LYSTIARATYVVTEVSFARLYHGHPLFENIYQLLRQMGFDYRGLWQLPDPRDSRALQGGAVFIWRMR